MIRHLLLVFSLIISTIASAQIIYAEDFEGGSIPSGWTQETNASDGGWKIGTAAQLTSGYFPVLDNGTNNLIGTNDDACNCDKNNDFLISPAFDLSGYSNIILSFQSFYTDQAYGGGQEEVTIEASLDKINWTILDDLHGHGSWDKHTYDLSQFSDAEELYIGFRYSDNEGWLYGFAFDDFEISVPLSLDANLVEVEDKSFGIIGDDYLLQGVIQNGGSNPITSLEITYNISGEISSYTIENLNIAPFDFYKFEIQESWVPTIPGIYNIGVDVSMSNGTVDQNLENNTMEFEVEIYDRVDTPNRIQEYLGFVPSKTMVANSSDQLNRPTDLDFFPVLAKDEMWIVNQRIENDGGSTTIIQDVSADVPSEIINRVDGNSWHFMSLPTGIAFSDDNLNFANSPGVQDANHSGGTFTGPALWSSDLSIYAQPSGGNGSHLDMLHGSPYSMGIAHEKDNVFWIYDDWNKDIVRYDFVEDHGPGADDHSDGIVRRYQNIGINTEGDIPNHMILDKQSGWLYFADNGNDRVMRLDINSGTGSNTLPLINEPLAEHSAITGFIVEEIITGIAQPCGIELIDNMLLVGDYASGDIMVYNTIANFSLEGTIATEEPGLCGIKIGPDGSIWYVNRENNTLMNLEPSTTVATQDLAINLDLNVRPNPSNGQFVLNIPLSLEGHKTIEILNLKGQVIYTELTTANVISISQTNLVESIYLVQVSTEDYLLREKISIQK